MSHPTVEEGDITRLDVRHRPASLKVAIRTATTVQMDGLQLTLPVRTSRGRFRVSVYERNGRLRSDVGKVRPIEDQDIAVDECGNQSYTLISFGSRCRVTTAVAATRLTAVIPRNCLYEPRWVRVGVELGGGDESLWHLDRWAPPGYDDTRWWIHTYGPRVRVSR